jgi:hypothetical protein
MPNRKDRDYSVGFEKTPRQTRFQPGQSGNPKGRPKGSKNVTTLFIQALFARVTIRENGRRRTITKLEAMVTQQVNKAVLGNPRATQIILDKMPEIERRHPAYFSPANEPQKPQMSPQQKFAWALEVAKLLRDLGQLPELPETEPESPTPQNGDGPPKQRK